jgi:hypothetical protein
MANGFEIRLNRLQDYCMVTTIWFGPYIQMDTDEEETTEFL